MNREDRKKMNREDRKKKMNREDRKKEMNREDQEKEMNREGYGISLGTSWRLMARKPAIPFITYPMTKPN